MSVFLGLMPNIGGYEAVKNQKLLGKLNRVQRMMCIRISSAYRNISGETANVITGITPMELSVQERCERYNGKAKSLPAKEIMRKWKLEPIDVWKMDLPINTEHLNLEAMILVWCLVQSEEDWTYVYAVVRKIVESKEKFMRN
ncbi:hypothetical protein Trydic_g20903 [Trypoxylus dichotomus]